MVFRKSKFVVVGECVQVRSKVASVHADCFLATTLDEVAWLYNLRGSDVPYNPGGKGLLLQQEPLLECCRHLDCHFRQQAQAGIWGCDYEPFNPSVCEPNQY